MESLATYNELPETIAPLDYESKAYNKKMPPILILTDRIPGAHHPMLKIITVGNQDNQNKESLDKIVSNFDEIIKKEGIKNFLNQIPKNTLSVTTTSGWEFQGRDYIKNHPELLETARKIEESMKLPLYYQNINLDNKYHLVSSKITTVEELDKLITA